MIDVENTVISQYANSPVICAAIKAFNDNIDPRADLGKFYDVVWNVETAQGFGLDTWGRIVGMEREIKLTPVDEFVGFSDGTTPFGSGSWATDGASSRKYKMDDTTYRRVIMLKAVSNIIYATAPNINCLLNIMFKKRGRAYYVINGTMMARYIFEFPLFPIERAIIRQTDLLPRPSGVLLDFFEPDMTKMFGFVESDLAPFGEGAFFIGY